MVVYVIFLIYYILPFLSGLKASSSSYTLRRARNRACVRRPPRPALRFSSSSASRCSLRLLRRLQTKEARPPPRRESRRARVYRNVVFIELSHISSCSFPARLSLFSCPNSSLSSSRPPTYSDMKDQSSTTAKAARLSMYPKKRPSPVVRDGGVARVRKTPGTSFLAAAMRCTPNPPELKRLREAQLLSQIRDTRLLEEEYRYDVLRYMHDMEVRRARYRRVVFASD